MIKINLQDCAYQSNEESLSVSQNLLNTPLHSKYGNHVCVNVCVGFGGGLPTAETRRFCHYPDLFHHCALGWFTSLTNIDTSLDSRTSIKTRQAGAVTRHVLFKCRIKK